LLSKLRARRNFRLIEQYLLGNVLDIGAGNCRTAELISKENDIRCIDVIDNNKTSLNLEIYDGKRLPYKDKSFDTSLLLYVLHHSYYPDALIKETFRVTKKRIIIFEDVYSGKLSLGILKVLDFLSNITSRMPMPYNFRREDEWRAILKPYGEVKTKKIPMILPRMQRMFVVNLHNKSR
jgi:ubiquinone/menaquinone biosynthesis C-methylase UbiE